MRAVLLIFALSLWVKVRGSGAGVRHWQLGATPPRSKLLNHAHGTGSTAATQWTGFAQPPARRGHLSDKPTYVSLDASHALIGGPLALFG